MRFANLLAPVAALTLALPAFAEEPITITDSYARVAGPNARSGAIFMVIENPGAADDRLIAATTGVAKRVELHTHEMTSDGVMQMIEVTEGFIVPAGGSHALARGGDHIMLMGLTQALNDGDTVDLMLTFEQAGEIAVEVPVDLNRKPQHGKGQMHGREMSN